MSANKERRALTVLKWPLTVLTLAIATSVALIVGGYVYLQHQRRVEQDSLRNLRDAQARLGNANKEIEDLRTSVDIYKRILALGIFKPENRLQWIESVNELKNRHRISALDYDIAPQQAVVVGQGMALNSIDVLGSRVQMTILAYHEADLLGFLSEVTALQNGAFPMDRCALSLLPGPTEPLGPRIRAVCVIDWITLNDKRATPQSAQPALPAGGKP